MSVSRGIVAALFPAVHSLALGAFTGLPPRYEENAGQLAAANAFVGYFGPVRVAVQVDGIAIEQNGHGHVATLRFPGARASFDWRGEEPLGLRTSYRSGRDRRQWREDIRNFARLRAREVYPGVDLVLHSSGGKIEYDFVAAPEADLSVIAVQLEGAHGLELGPDGDLRATSRGGTVIQRRPVIYQEGRNGRQAIAGRWIAETAGRARFALGPYDRSRTLTIDPVLDTAGYVSGGQVDVVTAIASGPNYIVLGGYSTSRSTFSVPGSAGRTDTFAFAMTVDATTQQTLSLRIWDGAGDDRVLAAAVSGGGWWVAGSTTSADFPSSDSPIGSALRGQRDGFIATANTASYFGGSGDDQILAIATWQGSLYVTGETTSRDLGASRLGDGPSDQGRDAFVAVRLPNSERWVTRLLGGPGDDRGRAVAVTRDTILVAGETTSSAFAGIDSPGRGMTDGFLIALANRADGYPGQPLFGHRLGGSRDDRAAAMTIDSTEGIVVAGVTASSDFPATGPSHFGGGTDAFVSRFTPSGELQASMLWGGPADEEARAVSAGPAGLVAVAGRATQGGLSHGEPLQPEFGGGPADGLLFALTPSFEISHSGYYGGRGDDGINSLAYDTFGTLFLGGASDSETLPVVGGPVRLAGSGTDGFFAAVVEKRLVARDWTVGKDLQVQASVRFGAPPDTDGILMTIASDDPSRVLFSHRRDFQGTAELQIYAERGREAEFWIQALDRQGEVAYTVSAPGWEPASARVHLVPSRIHLFQIPRGGGRTSAIRAAGSGSNAIISIGADTPDPQSPRGGIGLPAITVRSSSPTILRLGSPDQASDSTTLEFNESTQLLNLRLVPIQAGRVDVVLDGGVFGVARFPVECDPRLEFGASLDRIEVGEELQESLVLILARPAPAGMTLDVTPRDLDMVRIAALNSNQTIRAGRFNVATGAQTVTLRIVGVARNKSTVLRFDAPGYAELEIPVLVTPSGVILRPPEGSSPSGLLAFRVNTVRLDPEAGTPVAAQALRREREPLIVNLTSSNAETGTWVSPAVITGGTFQSAAQFEVTGDESTELGVETPQGFAGATAGTKLTFEPPPAEIEMSTPALSRGLRSEVTVRLRRPAPAGGIVMRIRTSNPAAVLVGFPNAAGEAEVELPPGATAATVGLEGLATEGQVTLTAEAEGYRTASTRVVLGAPTIVLSGPSRLGPNACCGQIIGTLAVLEQATGIAHRNVRHRDFNNRTPRLEATSPDSGLVLTENGPAWVSSFTAEFRARKSGVFEIRAILPDGFVDSPANRLRVSVGPQGIPFAVPMLGKDLQAPVTFNLGLPAGEVNVTSLDPERVLVTGSPRRRGAARIAVTGPNSGVWVQALAADGAALVEVSAGGQTSRALVRLVAAGMAIGPWASPATRTLDLVAQDRPAPLRIRPVLAGVPEEGSSQYEIRAGIDEITVPLSNENPSAGSLSAGRVSFTGGDTALLVEFRPLAPGKTVIEIGVPAGWADPGPPRRVAVEVKRPVLRLPAQATLGRDLQADFNVEINLLSGALPSGVTITSSDPTRLLVAPDSRTPGTASVRLTGSSFYVQALASDGTVVVRASGDGLEPAELTVRLTRPQLRFGSIGFFVAAGRTSTVTVQPGVTGNFSMGWRAGFTPPNLSITSSNPSIAAFEGPVRWEATGGSATIRGRAVGRATLTIEPPPGFETGPPLEVSVTP